MDPFVGEPVIAAGYFRVRWSGGMYMAPGIGVYIGGVITLVAWLVPRVKSRLPAYTYLAVTKQAVHLLEIRQGLVPAVRRVIGRLDRSELAAERLARWAFAMSIHGRRVELESVEYSEASLRVIDTIAGTDAG